MPDHDHHPTRARATRRVRPTDLLWVTYPAAWCAGLLLLPAGPAARAADEVVAEHYRAHGTGVAVQALLVHGVAGACLAALAVLLWRAGRHDRPTLALAALLSGVGAAAVSVLQAALAVTAVADATGTPSGELASAFHAVNRADVVKLLLLTVLVAAATRWCDRRLVTVLGVPLAALLPLGAASFLHPSPVLQAALVASLPLLLAWFAVTARAVGRAAAPSSSPAPVRGDDVAQAHPCAAATARA